MLRPFALLVAAAAVAAPACSAQSDAQAPGTMAEPLRVTSQLVVLDVVVLDRKGNFVSTLDRSQFHVTEDKFPQNIRNFDPPSGHAMPPSSVALVHSSADLPKIGNAPVNILVFDELNTPYMQIAYARSMMEHYLKRQPEVLAVPTLFLAAGGSRIAVLHDYTQSRADLLESMRKHTTEADFSALASSLNGGGGGASNGLVKTLGALTQVTSSVMGIPGRKNIIWVGTGYRNADDARNLSTLDEQRLRHVVQMVTNRMLAARVALYMVDPEGVVFRDSAAGAIASTNTGLPDDLSTQADTIGPGSSFESFVASTGGTMLFGHNDVDREIGQSAAEGTQYYTLAYAPIAQNVEHPYRSIRVTVDDPSLRVITRTGYFNGSETVAALAPNTAKKQPKSLQFDLLNAARTEMPYNGLHTVALRTAKGFALNITATDLQWDSQPDGSRLAEITVIAVCYGKNNKELAQHAAELKERIEATDRIDGGARVGFAFPVAVPPGTLRVRFVVRDAATGTLGSADGAP